MARRVALVGAPLVASPASSTATLAPSAAAEWARASPLPPEEARPPYVAADLGTPVAHAPSSLDTVVLDGARLRPALFTIAAATASVVRAGIAPVVVGGDCSVLPAALAGVLDGTPGTSRLGLVSFDGYAEFHTPATSTSRDFSGMALAATVGRGDLAFTRLARERFPIVEEVDAVRVGTRAVDDGERPAQGRSRVAWLPWTPGRLGTTVAALSAALGFRTPHVRSWVIHVSASALDRAASPWAAADAGPGGFRPEELERLLGSARAAIESAQGTVVGAVVAGFAPDGELGRREFARQLDSVVRLVQGVG